MTELIWEGKYVDGKRQSPVRVALPFQTIETVNESAADRQVPSNCSRLVARLSGATGSFGATRSTFYHHYFPNSPEE